MCSCDFCLSFKFIVGFGLGAMLCFSICYIIYTQDKSLFDRIVYNHTL
jgi:hypothetical protein